MSGYTFASKTKKERDAIMKSGGNINGWYTRPTAPIKKEILPQTPRLPQNQTKFQKEYDLCGFSKPYMGEFLDKKYAHLFGTTKTYFGLDSGFFCLGPLSYNDFFVKASKNTCDNPVAQGNPKWYNPTCRPWYKSQEKRFNPKSDNYSKGSRGTMTDLYEFANPKGAWGLTSCVPLKNKEKFKGTVCIDVAPRGPLKQYFEFNDE